MKNLIFPLIILAISIIGWCTLPVAKMTTEMVTAMKGDSIMGTAVAQHRFFLQRGNYFVVEPPNHERQSYKMRNRETLAEGPIRFKIYDVESPNVELTVVYFQKENWVGLYYPDGQALIFSLSKDPNNERPGKN